MNTATTPTMNTAHNSLLARLLASENITVIHRPDAKTAWFDMKKRELVLPMWQCDKQEVYDFLVGHEVGHAKFTPADEWAESAVAIGGKKNSKIAADYLNVVEDARIERMIKREFPGLRRDFIEGYKTLSAMDIFKLKGKDISTLSLIDRINLFYKLGVHIGTEVPFTEEERVFLPRINDARTFADVVVVATELYNFAKKQKEDEQSEEKSEQSTEENSDDESESEQSEQSEQSEKSEQSESTEENSDDSSESEKSESESESTEISDDASADVEESSEDDTGDDSAVESTQDTEITPDGSETILSMNEGMMKFAKSNIIEQPIRVPSINTKKVVVDSVGFIELSNNSTTRDPSVVMRVDAAGGMENYLDQLGEVAFRKMVTENARSVDQMCKRFEVRRAARNYARQSSAKSGRISTRLLAKYKFSEDIFERITIKNDEKNHGIVILLDWSGSMAGTINSAIAQLGALLLFCRRVGIPAEVYFFSTYSKFIDDRFFAATGYSLAVARGQVLPHYDFKGDDAAFTNEVCGLPSGAAGSTHAVLRPFTLIQVYHSDMNNKTFARTMGRLLVHGRMVEHSVALVPHTALKLGETPLNESILAMRDIVNNFRTSKNSKVTFIALTDGEGTSILNGVPEVCENDAHDRRMEVSRVMIDEFNGRRYQVTYNDSHNDVAAACVSMFKDATGCDIIGIMMTQNLNYSPILESALARSISKDMEYNKRYAMIKALREESQTKFNKEKFFGISYAPYTQYFFVYVKSSNEMLKNIQAKKDALKFDRMKNKKSAETKKFIAECQATEVNRMFINRLMDIVS